MKIATLLGAVALGLVFAQPGRACGPDAEQPSTYQASSTACPAVADIKTMPFRQEEGVDAAYDRFRYASDCDHVLIEALTSLRPMADPRCPVYEGFVEADAALFVLIHKYDIDIPDLLPKSEHANWKAQGVYAYFAYVEVPEQRAKANERLLAIMRKRNGRG